MPAALLTLLPLAGGGAEYHGLSFGQSATPLHPQPHHPYENEGIWAFHECETQPHLQPLPQVSVFPAHIICAHVLLSPSTQPQVQSRFVAMC